MIVLCLCMILVYIAQFYYVGKKGLSNFVPCKSMKDLDRAWAATQRVKDGQSHKKEQLYTH